MSGTVGVRGKQSKARWRENEYVEVGANRNFK